MIAIQTLVVISLVPFCVFHWSQNNVLLRDIGILGLQITDMQSRLDIISSAEKAKHVKLNALSEIINCTNLKCVSPEAIIIQNKVYNSNIKLCLVLLGIEPPKHSFEKPSEWNVWYEGNGGKLPPLTNDESED